LNRLTEELLRDSRTPGIAVAVVLGEETILARGYGYADLAARRLLDSKTVYPIASTTKAMNATLLGMLVDEGLLTWDACVQRYLPQFRLNDAALSAQVTVRDLIVMRTGLPRHDWMWIGYPTDRASLVRGLAFLERSAGFRERFQYNNLTAMTTGYLAEVVTGQSWETLIRNRLLNPLGMSSTHFSQPNSGNVTLSYHENVRRELIVTRRVSAEVTGPSGGSIHSTVDDMTRWLRFNLSDGCVASRRLIESQTLKDIHTPNIVAPVDQGAPSDRATYGLGWFVDTYQDQLRISHSGYLDDVQSSVTLLPEARIGVVSFVNFGPVGMAPAFTEQVLDLLLGRPPSLALSEKMKEYERRVEDRRVCIAATTRVPQTAPSHTLEAYAGNYEHPGYGLVEIRCRGQRLELVRGEFCLPLEHWHFDAWVVRDSDLIPIHIQSALDRSNRLLFETNADGAIAALTIPLEPTVAPIRFSKTS